MDIHYFQRYHGKENVATANTMLLLSRFYSHSSDKFFKFLNSFCFSDSSNPEITFNLQKNNGDSVPDATITQESFKIVVETKRSDWFHEDQLKNHLRSFSDETFKILMTLAPEHMAEDKENKFKETLKQYNKDQAHPVVYINTTFKELADSIAEWLDDRDYEMKQILSDFYKYCYTDHLIPVSDSWKLMRMRLASKTHEFNIASKIYYDKAEHGFRAHDYLGLYWGKSVRAIGKVVARITAVQTEEGMKYNAEFGELTEERKAAIQKAISEAETSKGWNLTTIEHRYFFVEKFYETDFKKVSPKAPFGARIFDLTEVLDTEKIPDMPELAEMLKTKTWM